MQRWARNTFFCWFLVVVVLVLAQRKGFIWTNSQAAISASSGTQSKGRVSPFEGRGFTITQGSQDLTTWRFWYSGVLQPWVGKLFWHDASDTVDHLQANNVAIHNLYKHIPLGKTLWAIFSLPDLIKKRFWKSFNTVNQCSVMASSQRSFTYLFLLSLDNTFEMFRCLKVLQTTSLIWKNIYFSTEFIISCSPCIYFSN